MEARKPLTNTSNESIMLCLTIGDHNRTTTGRGLCHYNSFNSHTQRTHNQQDGTTTIGGLVNTIDSVASDHEGHIGEASQARRKGFSNQ